MWRIISIFLVSAGASLAAIACVQSTSARRIWTPALHIAAIGKRYDAVLSASGFTMATRWAITSGRLPSGLKLDATTGHISGTPAEGGRFDFVAEASSQSGVASRRLSLSVFEIPLDAYGGFKTVACTNGEQPHFYTQKMGTTWYLCTPAGYAFFLAGVSNVQADQSRGDQGLSYYQAAARKYGDANYNWSNQISRRLLSWGFNAAVENTSTYMFPFGRPMGATLLPIAPISLMSRYVLTNEGNYGTGPVKSILDCLDTEVYTGWVGSASTPDVFDPGFDTYVNGRDAATMADPFWKQWFTSAWVIGITFDDSDELFGIGPGPEHPGTDGVVHPHIGWMALAASPAKVASARYSQKYPDATNFSKRQLIADLQSEYGTIIALNKAWRSTYTTFGSHGNWPRHATGGTGLLDEDGSSPWLGETDGTLKGAGSAVRADMDSFLLKYWRKYFQITRSRFKQYSPKQLLISPALNSHGGITRREILQAASEYCDVLAIGAADQSILDLSARYTGDRPYIFSQVIRSANPDSALWRYPNPFGQSSVTQTDRGTYYASMVKFASTATVSSNGAKPFVGFTFWAFTDSWGEKANWGLVTLLDNAYDGIEAAPDCGIDPWGFPTGGEERNYGNFLEAVEDANFGAFRSLAQSAAMARRSH
jgi:hypothetical protein